MYHSMYIGDKNTWDDYSLVPVNKIYISDPSQKTNIVEIEGASGSLDLSNYITGYPVYSNRSGNATFYLLDAVDARALSNSGYAFPANYTFYDIFDQVRGDLDGKVFKCWLEDDPEWFYEGRINVATAMGKPRPGIALSYDFSPYKRKRKPLKFTLNGASPIITRKVLTKEEVGSAPSEITFTVTGNQAQITIQCAALNEYDTRLFQPGTYTLYEWVVYGETSFLVSAATGTSVSFEMSPGRV